MNIADVPALLKQISYADPRVLRDDPEEQRGQIAMWASVLRDVPYDYALDAVGQHYANSPYPVLPSDISARWRATVRQRLAKHVDPAPPVDPVDEVAYRRSLRETRGAVARGETAPRIEPRRELASSVEHDDVRAMRQQGDLLEFIKIGMAQGRAAAARRKALVLKHADLAARLTAQPMNYQRPDQWAGALLPETWNGVANDSPLRPVVAELVAEAERREGGHAHPA